MSDQDFKDLHTRATNVDAHAPQGPVVHVRVEGRSRDIALDLLSICPSSPDDEIRTAIARFMELPVEKFRHAVIERHENGNLTVRPEALYG